MVINIIIILASLVAFNFLLLAVSCNKTSKKLDNRVPPFTKQKKEPTVVSSQLQTNQLAPTGS